MTDVRPRGRERRRSITRRDAERAIYVDFEGTAVDAPSFLGALWFTDGDSNFIQYVIEPELWPAAEAKGREQGGHCVAATWQDVRSIRAVAERESRLVVAWSSHEQHELAANIPDSNDAEWFEANVVNLIPVAKAWKRRTHPDVQFVVDPKLRMRGRHQLQRYFDLIEYAVPKAFGPGNSAQRISYVRSMLRKRSGDYASLTPVAKAKWTKALLHNWHDCAGLRELALAVASD